MLPDFPSLKKRLNDSVDKFIHREVRTKGVRQFVTNKRVHEGHRVAGSMRAQDRDEDESTFELHEGERKTTRAEIIEKGHECALDAAFDFIQEIAKRQEMMIMSDISKVATRQHGGVELTQEGLLEALKTMALRFDKEGKPQLQIVIPPITGLREKILSWNTDKEFAAKWDAIVREKHKEWLSRHTQRKLGD
jgi:hypothetical protein